MNSNWWFKKKSIVLCPPETFKLSTEYSSNNKRNLQHGDEEMLITNEQSQFQLISTCEVCKMSSNKIKTAAKRNRNGWKSIADTTKILLNHCKYFPWNFFIFLLVIEIFSDIFLEEGRKLAFNWNWFSSGWSDFELWLIVDGKVWDFASFWLLGMRIEDFALFSHTFFSDCLEISSCRQFRSLFYFFDYMLQRVLMKK